MYRRGATINTMVLTGMVIAVGVVVDDAIIDIENIVRRLRITRKEGTTLSTANVILDASLEVRGAVVYATLIEALTLLPIFFVQGLTGALFAPLALSYGLAVLVSMLVALTVTPAMGLILLGKPRSNDASRRSFAGSSPSITVCWRRILRAPRRVASVGRDLPRPGARRAAPRSVVAPGVQGAGLPDALDLAPGTSLPEERRIVTRRVGTSERSPACISSGPTSARRSRPRRSWARIR